MACLCPAVVNPKTTPGITLNANSHSYSTHFRVPGRTCGAVQSSPGSKTRLGLNRYSSVAMAANEMEGRGAEPGQPGVAGIRAVP